MTSNTIDNDRTMSGSEGTLLANRYRIVRQLGQGGMGSVWLAEDTQLDGKQFAIKMLPSILVSNKRAYAQLKSEALVAMKLVHPNIVQIRAFEENAGNPFLVMRCRIITKGLETMVRSNWQRTLPRSNTHALWMH